MVMPNGWKIHHRPGVVLAMSQSSGFIHFRAQNLRNRDENPALFQEYTFTSHENQANQIAGFLDKQSSVTLLNMDYYRAGRLL